jgi:hypothetical protein
MTLTFRSEEEKELWKAVLVATMRNISAVGQPYMMEADQPYLLASQIAFADRSVMELRERMPIGEDEQAVRIRGWCNPLNR